METNGNEMEMLERRFQAAERRMWRRLRATWTLALAGAVGAFVLGGNPEARAQMSITMQSLQNQINSLKTQVNDQNAQINSLKSQVDGQNTQLSGLKTQINSQATQISSLQAQIGGQSNLTARMASVEAKTAPISVSGNSLFIRGMNVFIQDGSGSTSSTNGGTGLGNLIIGYNASRALFGESDIRTGSHNLILGDRNNYSDFGGLVTGYYNSIGGGYATVTGGQQNDVAGFCSSVSGGYNRDLTGPVFGPAGPRWRAGNLPESS